MSHTNERGRKSHESRFVGALRCPACGASARRALARFCATCGRNLKDSFYAPADALLASYHQQHRRPAMLFERGATAEKTRVWRAFPAHMFRVEQNTSAAIALIFVFSSLVPYIGICFCPFAVLAGGYGLLEAKFFPQTGGARVAAGCILYGLIIAGAQILLWFYF